MALQKPKKIRSTEPVRLTNESYMPPNLPQLERAVLACIMMQNDLFVQVQSDGVLNESCFYGINNALVYRMMVKLFKSGITIDLVNLATNLAELPEHENPSRLTILDLTQIASGESIPPSNLKNSIARLRSVAVRREIMRECEVAFSSASSIEHDIFDVLDNHKAKLIGLTRVENSGNFENSAALSNKVFSYAIGNEPPPVYVKTGIQSLDDAMIGIRENDNLGICAGSGIGKTAIALQMAVSLMDQEKVCGIVSLEMEAEEIMMRIVSIKSGIPANVIESGQLTHDELTLVHAATKWVEQHEKYLHIVYIRRADTDKIKTALFSLSVKLERLGVKLFAVIIDYLQRISPPKYSTSRDDLNRSIDTIFELDYIAKDNKCAMIILSQFKKMDSPKERPTVDMIYGSKMFEATCHKILILDDAYRRGVDTDKNGESTQGRIYWYLDKNRRGRKDSGWFWYYGESFTFVDPNARKQQPQLSENSNFSWAESAETPF